MTSTKIRIAFIALLIIVLGVACSSKAQKSTTGDMRGDAKATIDKAGDTLNDVGKTIQARMDQFRTDMNANVATTDTKLQELKDRRNAMKDPKNQRALDDRLAQLLRQRDDLQSRIDTIKKQKKNEGDWTKFERDTKIAWRSLEGKVKETFDKLGG